MTDATVVIIVAAIPSTIAALTASFVAWAAYRQSVVNGAKQEVTAGRTEVVVAATLDTAKKAETLIQNTDKIHELTNSTNSNLQKALEVAAEKIAGFERLVSAMQQEKKDTAASQATADLQVSAAMHTMPISGGPVPQDRRAGDTP